MNYNNLTKEQLREEYSKSCKNLELYRSFSGRQGEQLVNSCISTRGAISNLYFKKFGKEVFER